MVCYLKGDKIKREHRNYLSASKSKRPLNNYIGKSKKIKSYKSNTSREHSFHDSSEDKRFNESHTDVKATSHRNTNTINKATTAGQNDIKEQYNTDTKKCDKCDQLRSEILDILQTLNEQELEIVKLVLARRLGEQKIPKPKIIIKDRCSGSDSYSEYEPHNAVDAIFEKSTCSIKSDPLYIITQEKPHRT